RKAGALASDATDAPAPLSDRSSPGTGKACPLLPRGPAALRRPVEPARRRQLRRERLQQAPQRERYGGAGPDAVHAGDVAGLRSRRRRPRPSRRDPRRRELPARERRAEEPAPGPLPLQPLAAVRRCCAPLCGEDPRRPPRSLRVLRATGVCPHAVRHSPHYRPRALGAQHDLERGPAAGLGAQPEASADAGGAGPHVPQALAARDGFLVEPGPVVDDADDALLAAQTDPNVGVAGACVLARVREALLD